MQGKSASTNQGRAKMRPNAETKQRIVRLGATATLTAVCLSQAAIVVTYERMREFFGNHDAKMIYLNSGNDDEVMFIDFAQNPLTAKRITNRANGGNPQISPDGSRVAFERNGTSYIAVIEENTTNVTEVGNGRSPHWWIHPETGKEYILLQRGDGANQVGTTNDGIYCVEIGADNRPVGSPQKLLDDPMANAGRSADGKFFANNDEESVRCHRGHGLYEVDPPPAVSNATILYWVYVSADGWWGGHIPYAGYCNGAMCPSGPGKSFYGSLLHMGSGHTEIYIRKPEGYEDDPWVAIGDHDATCPDSTIHYTEPPLITIPDPYRLGLVAVTDTNEDHWGHSDWSTHNDYICATGGHSTSSGGNRHAYALNIAKEQTDNNYGVKITDGGVRQPDLWVDEGGATIRSSLPGGGYMALGGFVSGAGRFVQASVSAPGTYHLSIVDLRGRQVLTRRIDGGSTATISVAGLSNGSYVARLLDRSGAAHARQRLTIGE